MTGASLDPSDLADLRTVTLVDLRDRYERVGLDHVDELLTAALERTADLVADSFGVTVDPLPAVRYNPLRTGGSYNPLTDELVLRGPRESLPGGSDHFDLGRQSLLGALASGLVSAGNQRLVDRYFEENIVATNHVHEQESETLLPGIDAGFTVPVAYRVDADITDRDAWDAFVAARVDWYRETDALNARRFEAVVRTVGKRVREAEGTGAERLRRALEIRTPLIFEGDTSVIDPD